MLSSSSILHIHGSYFQVIDYVEQDRIYEDEDHIEDGQPGQLDAECSSVRRHYLGHNRYQ